MLAGFPNLPRFSGEPTLLRLLQRKVVLSLAREASSTLLPIGILDYVYGWDISNWQPTIDWQKVKETAPYLKYVYIKSTEGTSYLSRSYRTQWDQAGKIGQLRGAYHYHHVELSGKAQAKSFLSQSSKGELPPVLDVEDAESLSQTPSVDAKKAAAQSVYEWVDTVANAWGQRVVIYTGGWFWNRFGAFAHASSQLTDYFGATYRTLDDLGPYLSTGWNIWTLWQFTSKGKLAGIPDYVDLSVFNGTIQEFNQWANLDTSLPPPPEPSPITFPYLAQVNNPIYGMYVRTNPSASSPKVKWIPHGFQLVISEEYNGWGKMQFGWVNLNYIKPL